MGLCRAARRIQLYLCQRVDCEGELYKNRRMGHKLVDLFEPLCEGSIGIKRHLPDASIAQLLRAYTLVPGATGNIEVIRVRGYFAIGRPIQQYCTFRSRFKDFLQSPLGRGEVGEHLRRVRSASSWRSTSLVCQYVKEIINHPPSGCHRSNIHSENSSGRMIRI